MNKIKFESEYRISELTLERSRLYHKPDSKGEIADINTELKDLRTKVRMCNNILVFRIQYVVSEGKIIWSTSSGLFLILKNNVLYIHIYIIYICNTYILSSSC